MCANAAEDACNWLIPGESAGAFCAACRHNLIIPDLSDPGNRLRWWRIEAAKHRLIYGLMRLGLPLVTRAEDPREGLGFDFLADSPDPSAPRVMTGHDNGLITISLAEADDAERERRRTEMREPYRTLLGHFRHEVGHWYWDRLVRDDEAALARVRALFGDDRQDYGEALKRHYEEGAPPDWRDAYVSEYATTHPWEDWAETFAHYLHIVEVLDTGHAYGLSLAPRLAADRLAAAIPFDPYRAPDIETLTGTWVPVATALNSLNRAMGQPDLYPFVLPPKAIEKLGLVQELVSAARTG